MLPLQPVDPYNIWSGYYISLRYELNDVQPDSSRKFFPKDRQTIYIVIEKDAKGVWRKRSAHTEKPTVTPRQRVILGTYHAGYSRFSGGGAQLGLETYYVPETARHEIAAEITKNPDRSFGVIALSKSGDAALVRIKVGDRVFAY